MNNQSKGINEIWLKASILGSLWAAFEIVFGNFIHSLRIPFGGQFMASLSVILLISAFQIWNNKGLFIRAGIICALLKLLSPGIKIFGPMTGIFAEAALLELGVSLFGKNIAGYMLGGGLAITWTLIQRIFNYLILYGMNLVVLYKNIYEYALKSLPFSSGSPYAPIVIILIIYMIMGAGAAFIGFYIGRKSAEINKTEMRYEELFSVEGNNFCENNKGFNNSGFSLIFLIVITAGYLAINPYAGLVLKIPIVFLTAAFVILRYRIYIKKIVNPKFWTQVIIITLLASYFIGGIKENNWGLTSEGLIAGIDMSVRAVFVLFSFTGISIEIKKPLADRLLKSKKANNLSASLLLTFETIPFFISRISREKGFFGKPLTTLSKMICELDNWEKNIYIYYNKNRLNQYENKEQELINQEIN